MTPTDPGPRGGLPDEATRARIIKLAFGGNERRYERFLEALRKVTPPTVEVILRGSAVTGTRWSDGQPFDADGPGTSDLDVTFVGSEMLEHWNEFHIPKLHSVPLSEAHPDASPRFTSLRRRLCMLVGRPVNLQATAGMVQYLRDVVMDQPYVTLVEKRAEDTGPAESPPRGDEAAPA